MMAQKIEHKTDWRIVIAAIAALVILESIAMFNGINGWLLRVVIFLIAGFGGMILPTPKFLKGG